MSGIARALAGPIIVCALGGTGMANSKDSSVSPATCVAILSSSSSDLFPKNATISNAPPTNPVVGVRQASGKVAYEPIDQNSDVWTMGWSGKAPPAPLVSHWVSVGRQPSGCTQGLAESHKISVSDSPSPGTVLIKIERPVVSDDGSQALALYTREGEGIGGQERLLFFTKVNGNWVQSGSRVISVS